MATTDADKTPTSVLQTALTNACRAQNFLSVLELHHLWEHTTGQRKDALTAVPTSQPPEQRDQLRQIGVDRTLPKSQA